MKVSTSDNYVCHVTSDEYYTSIALIPDLPQGLSLAYKHRVRLAPLMEKNYKILYITHIKIIIADLIKRIFLTMNLKFSYKNIDKFLW